jgi:hypothetical protein
MLSKGHLLRPARQLLLRYRRHVLRRILLPFWLFMLR